MRDVLKEEVGIVSIWAMSVEVALELMLFDPPNFENVSQKIMF